MCRKMEPTFFSEENVNAVFIVILIAEKIQLIFYYILINIL